MKVVILAGGYGTRISEESRVRPKPMIEIGNRPILWHIMKLYSSYGFNDFVICLGYKGQYIKEYFAHYYLNEADVTFDFSQPGKPVIHEQSVEPWRVTLVNTGQDTLTGGRVKRIRKYVEDETFMLTYGDGVANVDIRKLVEFHKKHGKTATVTSVIPPGRFGSLEIDASSTVTSFCEKPQEAASWINGGFFVFEPNMFNFIPESNIMFEREPLERMARQDQLKAFRHDGFWQPMDKMSDKMYLETLWSENRAPWKIWE